MSASKSESAVSVSTVQTTKSTCASLSSENEAQQFTGSGEREGEGFSNPFEFVITALGLAVGLGNIWRFPTRAFNNGGSAFLFPYIVCAITFGLPAVYLEFVTGQYQRASPPVVFRRVMPILEGVGWMCAFVATNVAIYYIVIVSWVGIYIVNLFRGDIKVWNKCDNPWNNVTTCINMLAQKDCRVANPPGWNVTGTETTRPAQFVSINGTCQDRALYSNVKFISSPEQYLYVNVIQRSTGLLDINHVNWGVFAAMTICWILTALLIWKGMKMLGKISYVTVILPYVLIIVLFFRGITLEGASTGLYYYFGNPDYEKILHPRTWSEALKQLCFSLSLGHGGLMSMASYNKPKSNCFLHAVLIITGDTVMSVLGGAAVFSTLGFLALQRNVTVPEVVESGISLAFVVYPEALSQMPLSLLWAGLFFVTLFLLGISSEVALTEVICTCLYDQYPKLRKRKWLVVSVWCFLLYLIGLVFSTDAGFYWFELFDEYGAGFSSVCAVTVEVICLMYLYGHQHIKQDVIEVLGEGKSKFSRFIGAQSPYWRYNWMFISPALGLVLLVLCAWRDYPYDGNAIRYPPLFDIVGWGVALLPGSMVITFAILNYVRFNNRGYPPKVCFMLQKQHKSYKRIVKTYNSEKLKDTKCLPDNEPWSIMAKFVNPDGSGRSMKSLRMSKCVEDGSRKSVRGKKNEEDSVNSNKELMKMIKNELQEIKKDMRKMKDQIDEIKEDIAMGPVRTMSQSKSPAAK